MQPMLAFIEGMFSPLHLVLLLGIGILLFGKRLPEVGRSLGKGIVEFKKGLKGLEDEFDSPPSTSHSDPRQVLEAPRPPQRVATTAPKFEDAPPGPTAPPQA
jgi:sec-independent protein translocase protein TatA